MEYDTCILRLDLNKEPLKEWVTKTVGASDKSVKETNAKGWTTVTRVFKLILV